MFEFFGNLKGEYVFMKTIAEVLHLAGLSDCVSYRTIRGNAACSFVLPSKCGKDFDVYAVCDDEAMHISCLLAEGIADQYVPYVSAMARRATFNNSIVHFIIDDDNNLIAVSDKHEKESISTEKMLEYVGLYLDTVEAYVTDLLEILNTLSSGDDERIS